ncbi:MAG: ShlB/FhaC/HecB family hemolysin secretion/activation protein [Alphaproteobacteria bacterium]|nr:ShlB/FhaC/HecB family hemolysin secretion/activation protein [Alphaproteobacteria bacterium]MBT5390593.1 ShlB/FhaC/HecB family hemolysin secretion/activation protein [Alphaproteobacteria bacterium]MBT5654354.1 ShlB/FhaC/HecB family hemolysin secretion/activation protein [Alphaproteobacteria bacterium]
MSFHPYINRTGFLALVAVFLLGVQHEGFAATTSADRASADPSLIERSLEPELRPESELGGDFIKIQEDKAPADADQIEFDLEDIIFEGDGDVIPEEDLEQFYESDLGERVTLGRIYEIANAITRYYRDQGYVLSRARVPAQEIEDGAVRIRIVEGFVDKITYDADIDPGLKAQVEEFANNILEERPLNMNTLERYLLLIKGLPGIKVESVLKPSKSEFGAADLLLIVKETSVDGSVGVNNDGPQFMGPWQGLANLNVNSVLGINEQLSLSASATRETREQRYFGAKYTQFLGSDGFKAYISGASSTTKPGDFLEQFEMKGTNHSLAFGVDYPMVRTRSESLYLGARFTFRNVKSSILSDAVVRKDRVRVLGGNITYDVADSWRGSNLLHVDVSQGFKIFGASEENNSGVLKSRDKGRTNFTKFKGTLSRNQGLWWGFSLYGSVNGQYSGDHLLSSERFSFGGAPVNRAYPLGTLTGDSGVEEKVEFRFTEMFDHSIRMYQFYLFYSAGTIWNRAPSSDEFRRISAAGGGGGLRMNFWEVTSFNIEYAMPFRAHISGRTNPFKPGIFFNLTQKF